MTPSTRPTRTRYRPSGTIASTWLTLLEGPEQFGFSTARCSPRTSTPPTVPGGARTTVLPDAQPDPRVTSGSMR